MKKYAIVLVSTALSACTAMEVKPLDKTRHQVSHVCIQENPRVTIAEFLPVVRAGFERHGLGTEVYQSDVPPRHCEYTLTYTARRSWDIATYLSTADLELRQGAELVSRGHYHLRNKGGLSLMKWQSVETKMRPVIDDMLSSL